MEHKDLEDEIPANKIIANWEESDEEKQRFDSIIESENYMEITEVDIDDSVENIEYVEYSDYNEDDVTDSNDATVKTEHIDDDNSTEVLYHCSTCNVNFSSTADHIREFHHNQSVIIEDDVENNENSLTSYDEFKTEGEDIDDENAINENMEEGYSVYEVDYTDKEKYRTISEETFFDASGRPYVRKKVRIPDGSLLESTNTQKCDECNAYIPLADFNGHKCDNTKSNSMELAFLCNICDKILISARAHARHMRTHKDPEIQENEARQEELDNKIKRAALKKQKQPPVPVTCEICNTTFPSNKSLRLHMRMHDPVKLKPIEDAIGYQMKACAKQGQIPAETFFCDICNKSYDKVFQEIHKKSHKNGPKHICSVCNKKFANQTNLDMHLQAHQDHAKIKAPSKAGANGVILPYECSFCGRQFVRPHEKVKHERIHTGEKPYKCEICGKCFRVSYCLTLHLRTHTGARPYVCPHCNKRFKAYSVYNHHLMTHSDERPYKCPHCPKAFKTAVQLGGHKNCHTKPFVCPECNRAFASLYAVKAHIETHKKGGQNLKHRCVICGAIYARVFALRDHIKEHHQTTVVDGTEIQVTEVPFANENETSTQSILPNNEGEITIGEIEHFQTEEVVTDWLK